VPSVTGRRVRPARKQSVGVRAAQEAARDSLEGEVIEWAGMPTVGLPLSEALNRDGGTRAVELERHVFLAFHLDQVPDPASEEADEGEAARRRPSTAELEAAAFAMALSVSLRDLASALKHGLLGQDDAAKATRLVRAGARLFDFPWEAPPKARRHMIMDLVEHQLAGANESIRDMKGPQRVRYLSSVALGVLSGICVRMPDLATAAQQPEALRAVVAVVRARGGVRDGGPGIDTALQRLFNALGLPLSRDSVRQARMDWKRERRDGKPRRRKKPDTSTG
jgi:hypothetical protein